MKYLLMIPFLLLLGCTTTKADHEKAANKLLAASYNCKSSLRLLDSPYSDLAIFRAVCGDNLLIIKCHTLIFEVKPACTVIYYHKLVRKQ